MTIDVPEALRGIPVPPFVLQPIVENAIKHGIARKPEGGDVIVRGSLQPGQDDATRLLLTVVDTGAGAAAPAFERGRGEGVGLRNLERRLECLYGSSASLRVRTAVDAGTTVHILLPVESSTAPSHRRDEVLT